MHTKGSSEQWADPRLSALYNGSFTMHAGWLKINRMLSTPLAWTGQKFGSECNQAMTPPKCNMRNWHQCCVKHLTIYYHGIGVLELAGQDPIWEEGRGGGEWVGNAAGRRGWSGGVSERSFDLLTLGAQCCSALHRWSQSHATLEKRWMGLQKKKKTKWLKTCYYL